VISVQPRLDEYVCPRFIELCESHEPLPASGMSTPLNEQARMAFDALAQDPAMARTNRGVLAGSQSAALSQAESPPTGSHTAGHAPV
jgi:hypothetical protein